MGEIGYWFISHSSKDIKIIEQIVDVLKKCGITYWKAPEMIAAGSNYAKAVPAALKNCDIVLFIVSEASQKSIWVEKEVDSAINARKTIIPVRIDDVPLNDMYSFYLNNIKTIDIQLQADGRISKDSLDALCAKFKENSPEQSEDAQTIQKQEKSSEAFNKVGNKKITEKANDENMKERNKLDVRTNALRINKIPVFCKLCGSKLEFADIGTYRCHACNRDYYDDFQKIRNFIRDNGPAPAFMIARGTGVSKQTVEYFFKDDVRITPEEISFTQNYIQNTRSTDKENEGLFSPNLWKR